MHIPFECSQQMHQERIESVVMHAGGAVLTKNCTFVNATFLEQNGTDVGNWFEMEPGTAFYSDDPTLQIKYNLTTMSPSPLEDIPETDADPQVSFLRRDDVVFATIRNVRISDFLHS